MEELKTAHPELYNLYVSLRSIDDKMKRKIKKQYGENSIKAIMALNDYNKQIGQAKDNIESVSSIVQGRTVIFDMITKMLYNIGVQRGFAYANYVDRVLSS